jgi:hypothetical protein
LAAHDRLVGYAQTRGTCGFRHGRRSRLIGAIFKIWPINDDTFKTSGGHCGHIIGSHLRRYRKIRRQRINGSRHSDFLQRVKK